MSIPSNVGGQPQLSQVQQLKQNFEQPETKEVKPQSGLSNGRSLAVGSPKGDPVEKFDARNTINETPTTPQNEASLNDKLISTLGKIFEEEGGIDKYVDDQPAKGLEAQREAIAQRNEGKTRERDTRFDAIRGGKVGDEPLLTEGESKGLIATLKGLGMEGESQAAPQKRSLLKRLSDSVKRLSQDFLSSKSNDDFVVSKEEGPPQGVQGKQGTPAQRLARSSTPITDTKNLLRKANNQELIKNFELRTGAINDMAAKAPSAALKEALTETAAVSQKLGEVVSDLNTMDLSKLYKPDGSGVQKDAFKEIDPGQMQKLTQALGDLSRLKAEVTRLENDPRIPKNSEESFAPISLGDTVDRLRNEINSLIIPPRPSSSAPIPKEKEEEVAADEPAPARIEPKEVKPPKVSDAEITNIANLVDQVKAGGSKIISQDGTLTAVKTTLGHRKVGKRTMEGTKQILSKIADKIEGENLNQSSINQLRQIMDRLDKNSAFTESVKRDQSLIQTRADIIIKLLGPKDLDGMQKIHETIVKGEKSLGNVQGERANGDKVEFQHIRQLNLGEIRESLNNFRSEEFQSYDNMMRGIITAGAKVKPASDTLRGYSVGIIESHYGNDKAMKKQVLNEFDQAWPAGDVTTDADFNRAAEIIADILKAKE